MTPDPGRVPAAEDLILLRAVAEAAQRLVDALGPRFNGPVVDDLRAALLKAREGPR